MAKKTIINPILAGNQLANSPLCSCSGLFLGHEETCGGTLEKEPQRFSL